MKNITRVTAACFAVLVASLGSSAQNNLPTAELLPCFVQGVENSVSCAVFEVPLNYDDPAGQQIGIHVAVMPATSSTPAADPLVVFAGGPGQAAGEYGALVELAFGEILKNRDIVLIDQRGTGKSNPLRCSYGGLADMQMELKDVAERCRGEHDIDVRHFTLENIMRDTDHVREQLGYEQLNLWGGSYGTKSVSLYMKRYPERVRSIIVDGVLPPDQSLFFSAPTSAERAVQKLVADCKEQPSCVAAFPDFYSQLLELVRWAEEGKLTYKGIDPVSGEYLELELEPEMVIESVRSVLYGAEGTTLVPYVITEAHKGNLQPMMASMLNGTALADSMYMGATLSLLCGEDVARITPEQAKKAGEGSFATDSYYRVWREYCSGWDYFKPTADDFFAPVESAVPALVLSGDLDPVTPPALGEHWMQGLSNGLHIIVEGTGHNTSHVGCMPDLLAEFLETLDPQALDASCLEYLDRLPIVINANGAVE